MAKHTIAKQYNWRRIAIMIVAAVALVGIIIITVLTFVDSRKEEPLSARSFINSIAGHEPLELVGEPANIRSATKCLDYNGELMAYSIVSVSEAGVRGAVVVRSYFDVNGETLIGIEVVEHNEFTKEQANKRNWYADYYGEEIADSEFAQKFDYAQMPLWFYDGSAVDEQKPEGTGKQIDRLSGATESCNAVVLAVNEAYDYLITNVVVKAG